MARKICSISTSVIFISLASDATNWKSEPWLWEREKFYDQLLCTAFMYPLYAGVIQSIGLQQLSSNDRTSVERLNMIFASKIQRVRYMLSYIVGDFLIMFLYGFS
jgi:hypothetical protein